jgi:serine/threonine protein kinase
MTRSDVTSHLAAGTARWPAPLEFPRRVGDWELVELAGGGSLTQVYRARPGEAGADQPAPYAVKMLRGEWQRDPRAIQVLRREALVGRSVSHPHLVAILATRLREPPYLLVMPWLAGQTLDDWVTGRGPGELPVVLWIARQVAEALDALHSAGWMHADVKPTNVFISPEGHVTLVDLGFARRSGEIGSAVDRCVVGTCNYIAPEMITSALRPDIRSDIYSLGVVLFQMLSGRLPYEGKDLAELATRHMQSRPPDLRRLVPHVPTEVSHLVKSMLAKEPLRRPQTPRELVDRLVALEIASFAERSLD